MAVTLSDLGYDAPRWGDPRLPTSAWERIAVDAATGCWLWLGGLTPGGYGRYRGTSAHLAVFRVLAGPTPEGLDADHLCHDPRTCRGGRTCRHRRCVCPTCLIWATRAEQLAPHRRNRWGHSFEKLAPLDVCKFGHEFTPQNTTWNLSRGMWVRRCKACARETARQWQARSRGKDPGVFTPRLDVEPRKRPPLTSHCPHGKLFTPGNTYIHPNGRARECTCPSSTRRNATPERWAAFMATRQVVTAE